MQEAMCSRSSDSVRISPCLSTDAMGVRGGPTLAGPSIGKGAAQPRGPLCPDARAKNRRSASSNSGVNSGTECRPGARWMWRPAWFHADRPGNALTASPSSWPTRKKQGVVPEATSHAEAKGSTSGAKAPMSTQKRGGGSNTSGVKAAKAAAAAPSHKPAMPSKGPKDCQTSRSTPRLRRQRSSCSAKGKSNSLRGTLHCRYVPIGS
mmetsp:Transcript_45892/g.147378  ORF Transcript_45892/g.147378 Transcript_45892/m.147378 type:complete len:207 (-) Transcript_45892:3035-3655(-)